jgi:putative ABC transport system ATP-binding protein
MHPVIQLEAVGKSFLQGATRTDALHPTDLTIAAGDYVAITGSSGSGKSTLLNLVAGIDRPSSGRIMVDAVDLGGLSEGALSQFRGSRIGIVFQFFELIPTLTALENIILAMDFVGRIPRPLRRDRALTLLRRVGLADHADKPPSRLSGGEQQRVAIARALANDPVILIADEPTGNLDRRNAELVSELFGQCAAEGRTVIIATHETGALSRYPRVLRIEDGHVRQEVPA